MVAKAPNMQDYDRFCREFRNEVPEQFNFGRDVIDYWAADRSRMALLWEDQQGRQLRFTFWDVKVLSNQLGNALRSQGIQRGDRVLLMLPRVPEWLISMVACLKIGAIPIPTPDMVRPKDIEFRVNHAGATGIITNAEGAVKADGVAQACPTLKVKIQAGDPVTGAAPERPGWVSFREILAGQPRDLDIADTAAEDPAVMYYTSGTTGTPKGIVHAHRAIYAWRWPAYCWIDCRPDDLHWCTADTGWSKFGTSMVFGPWSWGTPLLMYHGPFDPKQRLAFLEKHQVTTFCAAPTELRLMVQEDLEKYDLSSLRHCVSAGEPLNPEVIARWRRATGLEIYDGYGLTEGLMACHNYRCLPIKPGSMGKPLPGYELAILDEEGRPVPPGTEGDLAIRRGNPCLLLQYWGDPEATQRAYRGDWFITGDRAWVDEDGYYWFVGRGDDVILSAGYRIGPFEVESALATHPAVVESAAVGSPDPVRGEIVKAFVVLRPGFEPSPALVKALQEHVKQVTAPYKYPREIAFVSELPKTISGKIRRKELKQAEVARKGKMMGIDAPGRG